MELREALTQIAQIRLQMAQTEVFRGYRALPVAFSGLLALLAAGIQYLWIPDPLENLTAYLTLWVGAALVSACAAGAEMASRYEGTASSLRREITWLAVGQFLPALGAGAVLTVVLVSCARDSVGLLPGLWQILFSLGIFASHRLLPRPIFWVASFYMATGAIALAASRGEAALSPWLMGLPFGAGQLMAAAVLYWTLERNHGEA